MKTATVETSQLSGTALDWAVAKALGWVNYPTDSIERGKTWHMDPETAPFGPVMEVADWRPSTDWSQGGPLIEKLTVLTRENDGNWYAIPTSEYGVIELSGPSPLIAICRAIVAAVLGDDVEVPAELVEINTMRKLYNEEKVLYFANQKKALHVSCYEEPTTDLSRITQSLRDRGLIHKVADDDSGEYYSTTQAGERRLLELQIEWRTRRGKDVTEHRARLDELESEKMELNEQLDALQEERDAPAVQGEPVSHDWDDQDKCRRCGDRDWYASATCTPKQQPAEQHPYVARLVEALEDISGTHHHSASAGEYFAKEARKALAAYRKGGVI